MKRLLVLPVLFIALQANAQKLQLGAGGGLSFNGQPQGNLVYVGDEAPINYAGRIGLKYTFGDRKSRQLDKFSILNYLQVGIVGHVHELSSKSSTTYPGFPNRHLRIDSVGGDGKKLVYSKVTVASCLELNLNFHLGDKTDFYIGGAFGYGNSRNNSLDYAENESYNAPDGGEGFCFGGQLGFDQQLGSRVSFFLDAAFRYYNFKYDNGSWAPTVRPIEVLEYSIWAMPITVGLNFTLYETDDRLMNTYNKRARKFN